MIATGRLARAQLGDTRGFTETLSASSRSIPAFRTSLARAREHLKEAHRGGAPAPEIVHWHARLVDEVLKLAFAQHCAPLADAPRFALVAVGGYGRGELHPHSDVDLLLLLGGSRAEAVRAFVEAFVRFLWDIGLEVGHSVRTVKECLQEARRDITVMTNLLEARLLAGDAELVAEMRERTSVRHIWPPETFFAAKLAEQLARHARFQDTAYNLEPDLKEGPGGLRDIQTLSWVMQRRHDVRDLQDLIALGFLTEPEYRALIRGRNFLWRVRNGLHFLANRREDRLLFDHQRLLAKEFRYRDRRDRPAVEYLMMRYYRTVKELRLLNEILLQQYQEENPGRHDSRPRTETINRRFRAVNGYLDLADARVFERQPLAMLELFHLLQLHPELKGVRAPTIRALRAALHRIDQEFRDDLRARSLFMEIMRAPSGQTHVLRRMNAYGVLGAYLPVFGAIVGQMQYDLFHVYTVDAHSLFVVRNLRRFALQEHAGEFPLASELMAGVFKRERLYLAGLFHDIAKGRGGDHSLLGEEEALAFCRRHDMSEYDAHFVAWLVRNHLLMSRVAQRQDIGDHDVVVAFARTVGDVEHLNHLYLLTIADIRATSPHVWNAWKGRLLEDLYYATRRVLRQGFGEPLNLGERVRDTQAETLSLLKPGAVAPLAAREFWASFEPDYFLRHNAREIAWHLAEISTAPASAVPLVAVRRDPRGGALTILVYAPESEELLSAVTGGMTRMNLDIADARLHQTRTNFALYVFVVLENGASSSAELAHELRRELLQPARPVAPRPVQLTRLMRHFPIAPRVDFPATGSTRHTVMEVIAQDHPGLLHKVALCLTACKVRLVNAKIATFGERAEDVFFITDRDGRPLSDAAQRECLHSRIVEALELRTAGTAAANV